MGNSMDYIYTLGEQKIVIEVFQEQISRDLKAVIIIHHWKCLCGLQQHWERHYRFS